MSNPDILHIPEQTSIYSTQPETWVRREIIGGIQSLPRKDGYLLTTTSSELKGLYLIDEATVRAAFDFLKIKSPV